MKAVYFTDSLLDLEESKSRRAAGRTIMGQRVYRATLLKALVRYSSYDRLFITAFPSFGDGDLRDSALFAENRSRSH